MNGLEGFPACCRPGERIGERGEFRLIREIGRGGMSVVFLAEREEGALVAVKVIKPSLLTDLKFIRRLDREVQILVSLEHPGIVSLYDVVKVDNTVAFVMQYVDGVSLYEMEKLKKRLPLDEALRVMDALLDVLSYAHREGVVHRDIKPENILLSRTGEVFLADFGIAKSLRSAQLTQTGQIIGSPFYLSPEQIKEATSIDHRADLYSAGVLLYEMLTGRVPFYDKDPLLLLRKHVKELPPPPSSVEPSVTPAVESVILRAMAKKAEERFLDAGAMKKALHDAVERGVKVPPPSEYGPVSGPGGRGRKEGGAKVSRLRRLLRFVVRLVFRAWVVVALAVAVLLAARAAGLYEPDWESLRHWSSRFMEFLKTSAGAR